MILNFYDIAQSLLLRLYDHFCVLTPISLNEGLYVTDIIIYVDQQLILLSVTDVLVRGDSDLGEPLYWDSYDRHCLGVGGSSPRPLRSRAARCSVPSEDCLHPNPPSSPPLYPYTTPPSTPPVNKGKCEYSYFHPQYKILLLCVLESYKNE